MDDETRKRVLSVVESMEAVADSLDDEDVYEHYLALDAQTDMRCFAARLREAVG